MDELGAVVRPRSGALTIEKDIVTAAKNAITAFLHIETDRRKVVYLADTEILRQHSATVSVNPYIFGGTQTGRLQVFVGEAIDARLANAYLDPRAAAKNRGGGIGMLYGSYAAKTEEQAGKYGG